MKLLVVLSSAGTLRQLIAEPAPLCVAGFREKSCARIGLPAEGRWSFFVDDEPLAEQEGEWLWEPGFFAGTVRAELRNRDTGEAFPYLFDVAPDDRKLGQEHFRALLAELAAEDPALILGDEPASWMSAAERELTDDSQAWMTFERFRKQVPLFLEALAHLERHPRSALRPDRATLPLHRARRLDRSSLRGSRGERLLRVLASAEEAGAEANAGWELEVPVVERHLDSAANRCVAALIGALSLRARRLREAFERHRTLVVVGGARTSLASRAPERLRRLSELEHGLRLAARRSPWCEVSRAETTAAGLNAVSADPSYARAFHLGWSALRTHVGGEDRPDRFWMSPTWELFERWAFVRLGRLIRDAWPSLAWERFGAGEHDSGALAGWSGTAAETRVELLLQVEARAKDQPPRAGFSTVSGLRIPDLLLSWRTARHTGFIALDAKYRQSRSNVLDAMGSAHIYRDALRWHGLRPDLALLITPAQSEVEWLYRPDFQAAERVGAVCLGDALPEMLSRTFAALTT